MISHDLPSGVGLVRFVSVRVHPQIVFLSRYWLKYQRSPIHTNSPPRFSVAPKEVHVSKDVWPHFTVLTQFGNLVAFRISGVDVKFLFFDYLKKKRDNFLMIWHETALPLVGDNWPKFRQDKSGTGQIWDLIFYHDICLKIRETRETRSKSRWKIEIQQQEICYKEKAL